MKKYLCILFLCLLFTGCNKVNEEDYVKKFQTKLSESDTYVLEADMEIYSNETSYNYSVVVNYMKGDFYKVSLKNTDTSHEQIILKNEEGVYVITPALNKSFKFQSEWPYNSSQSYILDVILKDMQNTENRKFVVDEDTITLETSVNYPNNTQLKTQKIIFDKQMNLKNVTVMDSDGKQQIVVNVKKINFDNSIKKEDFSLENNVKDVHEDNTETTAKLDSVLYPMYIPSGTTFKSEQILNGDKNERAILTFTGEKPFILVEEVGKVSEEFEINSSPGDLVFYENILGSITDTSLSWTSNGIEYYLVGENLTSNELLSIATSTMTVSSVVK